MTKAQKLSFLLCAFFIPSISTNLIAKNILPSCYGVPYGKGKVNYDSRPIGSDKLSSPSGYPMGTLSVSRFPLPIVPLEISRIERGYISEFSTAFSNVNPIESWFGIDLDRKAAFLVDRYQYDLREFSAGKVGKTSMAGSSSWGRKWVHGNTVEIEVVRFLPGNVGATNFSSFVCSANAFWLAGPSRTGVASTDTKSESSEIVDVSENGRTLYSKAVAPGDPVYDAAKILRNWMDQ